MDSFCCRLWFGSDHVRRYSNRFSHGTGRSYYGGWGRLLGLGCRGPLRGLSRKAQDIPGTHQFRPLQTVDPGLATAPPEQLAQAESPQTVDPALADLQDASSPPEAEPIPSSAADDSENKASHS